MSSRNITDSSHSLHITRQDTLAMIFSSIAHMIANMSKLIEAETKMILFIIEVYGYDKLLFQHIADINESVNSILINIIQIQMLLELKLQSIIEFFTTTPTMIASKKNDRYCLKGRGVGLVSNRCDPFYSGITIVQACIHDKHFKMKDNFLYYSVQKGSSMETFSALASSLKMKCYVDKNSKTAVIEGTGSIVYKKCLKPDIMDTGKLILTIGWGNNTFLENSLQFVIKADNKYNFNHDSGIMNFKGSTLEIDTIRKNSINSILTSVACQGFKLADILHKEAEKIQHILGTSEGKTEYKPTLPAKDLIILNKSVGQIIKKVIKKEILLQSKLERVLETPIHH